MAADTEKTLKNHPIPMTKAKLVSLLGAIQDRVEAGDSFEGGLEYLMPAPPEDHVYRQAVASDFAQAPEGFTADGATIYCGVCGIGTPSLEDQVEFHAGDPATTADGEPTEFMVKAGFRVGNLMGQGGFVMIGDMR